MPKTLEIEKEIQAFIENPNNRKLALPVIWVVQKNRDFPKHLSSDENLFLCGSQYINEEFTDGTLIEISLLEEIKNNVTIHSIEFIFSEQAQFILCKKCLAWLRKKLQSLESNIISDS